MLAQKPAAAADHLDPKVALKDFNSLPSVPTELMTTTGSRYGSERIDLNELIDQLEKAVLQAKLLFKKEQRLLAKTKADRQSCKITSTGSVARLQALGTARNELINWIETELAKAAESSVDSENGQDSQTAERTGRYYIESQLVSIQRQYSQYTQGRQALIVAANATLDAPAPTVIENDAEEPTGKEEADTSGVMSHVICSYLKELTSVSNEQKSLIQQKSHLTISLAKQLKEAGKGLDRLVEESHLLPSYPVPTISSQRKGLDSSTPFGGEISDHEKPDSSRRARAWVFASESASHATKEAISEKLEDSEMAVLEARQNLLELQRLFGEDFEVGSVNEVAAENRRQAKSDSWATLDGRLGVIKRHDVNQLNRFWTWVNNVFDFMAIPRW